MWRKAAMIVPGWLPAAAVAAMTFAVLIAEAAGPKPGTGSVAFWSPAAADLPAAATIADAVGGRIARPGGFSGWWIVATAPGADAAGLYRAGAWLVVDPKFLQACARVAPGEI